MDQTAYLPLQSIGRKKISYVGGICKWYYTPIQNIASFPAVDPQNQKLLTEPILHVGKSWYGPVNVPDSQLGWQQEMQRTRAGIFFKQKVGGYIPGLDERAHINLQNLMHHQVCIVAKVRSGGHHIIVGNDVAGLDLDDETTTGAGANDTPGTKFVFTGESINRAHILPSFAGTNVIAPPDVIVLPPTTTDDMEIIFFNNTSSVTIPYTTTRRANFGNFPSIEVWVNDSIDIFQVYPEILVDLPAPNQTSFTVKIAGPASGFIKIHK